MKINNVIALIAVFLLSGCTSTYFIEHDESAYEKLNIKLKGKKAIITKLDGQKIKGMDITTILDSTSVNTGHINLERRQFISTSQLKEIKIVSHSKGAGDGFLFGGLLGLFSALVAKVNTSGQGGDAENVATLIGIIGVAGFSLIGLLSGAAIGHKNKYLFVDEAESTSKVEKEPDISLKVEAQEVQEIQSDTHLKAIEMGEIGVISERTGEVIDLEIRNKYRIFLGYKGFQTAVLYKLPDGKYIFKITYLDEVKGEEKIKLLPQTALDIKRIKEYIEKQH